jgi:hypothetical protein
MEFEDLFQKSRQSYLKLLLETDTSEVDYFKLPWTPPELILLLKHLKSADQICMAAKVRFFDLIFIHLAWLYWQEKNSEFGLKWNLGLPRSDTTFSWNELAEFAVLIDPSEITQYIFEHREELNHIKITETDFFGQKQEQEISEFVNSEYLDIYPIYYIINFILTKHKLPTLTRIFNKINKNEMLTSNESDVGSNRLFNEALYWVLDYFTVFKEIQIIKSLILTGRINWKKRIQHLIMISKCQKQTITNSLEGFEENENSPYNRLFIMSDLIPENQELAAWKAIIEVHNC